MNVLLVLDFLYILVEACMEGSVVCEISFEGYGQDSHTVYRVKTVMYMEFMPWVAIISKVPTHEYVVKNTGTSGSYCTRSCLNHKKQNLETCCTSEQLCLKSQTLSTTSQQLNPVQYSDDKRAFLKMNKTIWYMYIL